MNSVLFFKGGVGLRVDQLFSLRQLCKKREKGEQIYPCFVNLEKGYNKVDRKGIREVMKMYRVGGKIIIRGSSNIL